MIEELVKVPDLQHNNNHREFIHFAHPIADNTMTLRMSESGFENDLHISKMTRELHITHEPHKSTYGFRGFGLYR